MDTAFRILEDINSNGLEPILVGDQSNRVQQILGNVQASLAPLHESLTAAQGILAQVLSRKEQSADNVLKGEQDAAQAYQLLADHEAFTQEKKAARAQARAERIASGGKAGQKGCASDDTEIRRLTENAEEADAALTQLQEVDRVIGVEFQKAEAAVTAATTRIDQAHAEGIATAMLEYDSIIRGLHSKLYAMVPGELYRSAKTARPSAMVKKALTLVFVDERDVAVNALRGIEVVPTKWTALPKPQVTKIPETDMYRVPGKEDMTFVPEPLPRNAAGIKQKI